MANENTSIGIEVRLKSDLSDANRLADSFQKVKEKASELGLDDVVQDVDRLADVYQKIGDRFGDLKRQIREFNEGLVAAKKNTDQVSESGSRLGDVFKGVGVGTIFSLGIREGMKIPAAVASQYGPVPSGLVGLAGGGITAGIGTLTAVAGASSLNPAIAAAGGAMMVAGAGQIISSITDTIGSIIGQSFSGVEGYMNLEVQRQRLRTMFQNPRMNFGALAGIGVSQSEYVDLAGQLGSSINNFDPAFLSLLAGYGRARGIGTGAGVALGGQIAQFGGEFDQTLLRKLDALADRMSMGQARLPELIGSVAELQRMFLFTGINDPNSAINARAIPGAIFGDSEIARSGGLNFLSRLQSGITQPGSEASRFFFLRAAGLGSGKSLTDVLIEQEKGIGSQEMFSNIQKNFNQMFGGAGRDTQNLFLKGLFPQLSTFETDKMRQAFLRGDTFAQFQAGMGEGKGEDIMTQARDATTRIAKQRVELENKLLDVGERLADSVLKMQRFTNQLSVETAENLIPHIKALDEGTMTLTGLFNAIHDAASPTLGAFAEIGSEIIGVNTKEEKQKKRLKAFEAYNSSFLGMRKRGYFGVKNWDELEKEVETLQKAIPSMSMSDLTSFKLPPGVDANDNSGQQSLFEYFMVDAAKKRAGGATTNTPNLGVNFNITVQDSSKNISEREIKDALKGIPEEIQRKIEQTLQLKP